MSFYHRPRRLLLTTPLPDDGGRSRVEYGRQANFDKNMVIILAALLCALICALGINSIVKCVVRSASRPSPVADGDPMPRFGRRGLRKSRLRQIPVEVYAARQRADAFTECPICLGEFVDGEKIRVLPGCRHFFHVKCVDVWLVSHTSCPTCRRIVAEDPADSDGGAAVSEAGGSAAGNGSGGHGDGA